MSTLSCRYEKHRPSSSPFCSVIAEKSTLLPSTLALVPVFSLSTSKPSSLSCSLSPREAGSPDLPPDIVLKPTCISPLRNVPFVSITASARNSVPKVVVTPFTTPSSMIMPLASSCHIARFSVCSRSFRHSLLNSILSHCARGLHMAGPLLRFSMRN